VPKQRDAIIRIIGSLKLLKGLVLVAVGVGALSLLRGDAAERVAGWINAIGFDPDSHHFNKLLTKLRLADDSELEEIGVGSLVYAAMFLTEGVGLVFRKVWAEYLTVVITTSFIPFEIYELAEHKSPIKAVVLVLNIAIVVYLVLRLRRDKHWPFKR
jgi:uncharacterized membrane protein (DUF2068 family)